jgi:hypothetical protein
VRRRDAVLIWLCTALFSARVAGQLLVTMAAPGFLPPMERWYSGWIPYPVLLPAQVAIVSLQLKIGLDFARGWGFFAAPRRPRLGRRLRLFAALYAAAMLLRLLLALLAGGGLLERSIIPVAFHFVLAAQLFVLGGHHVRGDSPVALTLPA